MTVVGGARLETADGSDVEEVDVIVRVCMVASAVIAASLGASPSALAQPRGCGETYLCGYGSTNYKGKVTAIGQGVDVDDLSYGSTAGFVNARSAYNRDTGSLYGHCAIIYSEKDYRGKHLTLKPHTGISALPQASSWKNGKTVKSGFWHGIQSVRWSDC